MGMTQANANRELRRMLPALCVIPLFLLGLTSCAVSDDGTGDAGNPGAGSDSDSTAPDDDADGESLESLDSAELLELGMAGDAAVKCTYANGDITGTIYFDGAERQRFDSVTADGVPTHIVLHDGRAHAWNDAEAEGARYPEPEGTTYLVSEDPAEVKAHSTDCVPHDDPSAFELPPDVTFADLPTG